MFLRNIMIDDICVIQKTRTSNLSTGCLEWFSAVLRENDILPRVFTYMEYHLLYVLSQLVD